MHTIPSSRNVGTCQISGIDVSDNVVSNVYGMGGVQSGPVHRHWSVFLPDAKGQWVQPLPGHKIESPCGSMTDPLIFYIEIDRVDDNRHLRGNVLCANLKLID